MPNDVDSRLTEIFRDLFRYEGESVSDDVSMETLDRWDSMQHLLLVSEIENAFRIRLTTDDILSMTSAGEIRRVLKRRLEEK